MLYIYASIHITHPKWQQTTSNAPGPVPGHTQCCAALGGAGRDSTYALGFSCSYNIYICVCLCIYIYVYTYIYRVHTHTHLYVYMYTSIYIYIYTHIEFITLDLFWFFSDSFWYRNACNRFHWQAAFPNVPRAPQKKPQVRDINVVPPRPADAINGLVQGKSAGNHEFSHGIWEGSWKKSPNHHTIFQPLNLDCGKQIHLTIWGFTTRTGFFHSDFTDFRLRR